MTKKVIHFHYTLKDSKGLELESSFGETPLAFLEGAQNIIPGLEAELVQMKVGERKSVSISAKDAYGEHDASLVMQVPAEQIPDDARSIGSRLQAQIGGHIRILTVTAVTQDQVTVDGNHPLSGQDLSFDVEITEVREASNDEMLHGHVHGPHGHHQH